MIKVHKKKDGYLMIGPGGVTRYMTLLEAIVFKALGIVPERV